MPRPLLALLLIAMPCCAPARPRLRPERTPPPTPREVWVDASAPGPGDGSRTHPYRLLGGALAAAFERASIVHLATGLYRGPFDLPPGTHLVGGAAVVLHAEGPAVIHASAGAILEDLQVQGAAIGLVANGQVELRRVKFSGQREIAIRVERGRLTALLCELTASISGVRGMAVGPRAAAELFGCSFTGPFGRAVEATAAQVKVSGSSFAGPAVGVHQVEGQVELESSLFSGGRGPAIFAAGGLLTVRGASVLGHEYALQTGPGTRLKVADLVSVRAQRAALALVHTQGSLSDVVAIESGSFGAAQLLSSDLLIERFFARAPLASGVLVRLGRLVLKDAVILAVRAEADAGGRMSGGDAVVVRGAEVRIEGLTVFKAAGFGLVATAEGKVELSSGVLDECRTGGLAVDGGAKVDAVSLLVRRSGGAAIVLPGPGRVRADLLSSEHDAGGPVWVDCNEGGQVLLSRARGDSPVPKLPCIGQWVRSPDP